MWTLYLCGWVIAAAAAFVVADTFPEEGISPPRGRGALAVAAGAIWPVVLIGLLQIVLAACVAGWLRTAEVTHR